MTDDIVTRLRKQVARAEVDGVLPSWDFAKVVWEAADEIERLRADVKRWSNWAEEYFYTDPDCECPLCDQVKAAINNG